ncbi:hypothetical protein SAMN05421847_2154 [Halpernia humi]|uniref:Uncharacterized protein n=1 Tax=Halpernia humi TaxID=493375 RepID=A0A1H5ZSI8_9FLAO|nr:hypothetical protein [Halpernia humi]SEG38745.1 hypothetical protein SAMN05421847_2154 [Halpernia humi]
MKEELIEEMKQFLKKMSDAKIAAIFLAANGENYITCHNCSVEGQAQLLVNHIDSTPEMQEAFTNELELVTKREQMQENG